VKLGRLPYGAVQGQYLITLTGTIGAVIKAGTTFKSLDNSSNPDKLFVVDADFTFASATETVQIRALEGGTISRVVDGDGLQVTAPIANVDSFGTIDSTVVEPVDAETIEQYREKVIQAYRTEPQGGASVDYKIWAVDAAGVRTVYPYVKNGASGELDIYIEALPESSTDGNGTPSSAMISDVEDVIELDPDTTKPMNERGRRPISVFAIHFMAIITNPVDVAISNLSDTSFLDEIKAALSDFLYNVRPFISGADNPNEIQKDRLYASQVYNIVIDVIGTGNTFDSITVSVNGVETLFHQFIDGNIPYARNVIAV
jgi:hypothetical protein